MKKEDALSLGQRIKEIRQGKNVYHKVFNQKDFAKHIGATVQALSNWENGRNKPNAQRTQAIANLAGINVDELLENKNYMNTKKDLIFNLKSDINLANARINYLEQKIDTNGNNDLRKADDIRTLVKEKNKLYTLEKNVKSIEDANKYKLYFYHKHDSFTTFILDPDSIENLTIEDIQINDETMPWNFVEIETYDIIHFRTKLTDILNKKDILDILKSYYAPNVAISFLYVDNHFNKHSYNEKYSEQVKVNEQIIM